MTLVLRILEIISPVIAIIAMGWFIGRQWKPDTAVLNRLALDVFGPMLVLSALSAREFDLAANTPLILAALTITIGSGIIALPFARITRTSQRTFLPPMMFNNSGNMGIPLALFAFGEAGMGPIVIMFVTANLLHFTLGVKMVNPRANMMNFLVSPMVLATAVGATLGIMKWHLPPVVYAPLKLLGDATIPIMLLALGVRMTQVTQRSLKVAVVGAIVCPVAGLFIAGLFKMMVPLTAAQWQIVLLFSVLPPAVLNFLVAERYQQEPAKVASIVLIGNIASLIFVPIGLALAIG